MYCKLPSSLRFSPHMRNITHRSTSTNNYALNQSSYCIKYNFTRHGSARSQTTPMSWFTLNLFRIKSVKSRSIATAEIRTTFGVKVVQISARNTKVCTNGKFCKAIFTAFFNILRPNFALLLFLIRSFQL